MQSDSIVVLGPHKHCLVWIELSPSILLPGRCRSVVAHRLETVGHMLGQLWLAGQGF